ncbi:PAS domain-containing protein [Okeanomitos corallinicola TIOX110]|uniref:histidine kinase n=1 Tax=Okeanomitos corallinicola TIOX110 TaxID=3133117 RepID=A0ABZ2UVN0_9CYAN
MVNRISHKLAIATTFIGFIVLLGWIFNIPVMKSILPEFVTMKFNTALGFLLGGISLYLWINNSHKNRINIKLLSKILAFIVLLLGLTTLIQYSFKINLGIDELLIKDSENSVNTSNPGRMAPNTAICFFWLGSSLLLLHYRKFNLAQFLAGASFLIALLGFVGYVFGISDFYYIKPLSAMALHTSVSFLLLSTGILLASCQNGWMQEITSSYMGGIIARNLIPLIVIFPIFNSGLFLFAHQTNILPVEIGFVFLSILNIAVLGVMAWWNARYINNMDKKNQYLQQELQAANENLETKVNERTQQLENVNEALEDSRHQLSNLINTLPGIVFYRSDNDDWSIESISDGYLPILYDCQKESCQPYRDYKFQNLIITDDIPKILLAIDTAIKNNTNYQVEYRILTPSGQEKWLLETGVGTLVNGERKIQGFMTEITSLKKTQAALAESENKFRELAENIDEIFHINSADLSEMLYISPGYEKIWGISRENIYQNPNSWIDSVHQDDYQHLLSACQSLMQGKPLKEEYRIIRPDEDIRWISGRVFPVYDQNWQILRHVGVATDITERKLTEIALKYSEERYRSLVKATTQVIWTTDGTGQFVTPQSSWEAFTGKGFAEHQGWNWTNSIHPDDQERTKKVWLHSLENRCLYENECRILSKAGEYMYFWVRAVPIMNNDDSIREWVGACTEITERKKAELEIRQLNEQLEERVQQRTAELTAANKELEAFSYSVSHDLRAPLRGIDGFSKTLLESYGDKLDDRGKHYLNRVRAGTQRMGELIDDMLQLSRVSRSEMKFTTVNLSAIAQGIAQELSENEPQRQVEWLISQNLRVQGDAHLLRIVLENLLNNAWKFTSKKKQAIIELNSMDSISDNNDYTTYIIRDNGDGFDQAYVHKLFQAFQRLHSGAEFPGTGIGLATVKRIINRHGGDVWAEGVVGESASFYFTLHN